MSSTNSKVDGFLQRAPKWREEMEKLRAILLDSPLTEELKWGKPCYTFQGSNVVLILPFKDTCALLLNKGALLNDPAGILIRPTENTQAARQIRFTSAAQIAELEIVLKGYIQQAIEVEEAGLKVDLKAPNDFAIPDELQHKFNEAPAFETAFHALTPGRQRAYYLHFSAPKQSKTRESRIEKCMPQILEGKGLNDR
ncbi:hypothetical protein EON80_05325 [bacterium]|nr:MAG: hypothetical protein EON80_05325 [bacterium]